MNSTIVNLHIPCPKCPSSDAYVEYADGHGYCFACQYFKPSKEDFLDNTFTYEYLPHRGLTKKTLEFYDIKTKVDHDGKPVSCGFIYPSGSIKVRHLDQKLFTWTGGVVGGTSGLFGRDRFPAGSSKTVTISEGEYDAASLYQVLHSPCVSVTSSSAAARDCTMERSWLNSFERIYLAFDGDGPGREAVAAVARLFDYNKVFVLDFDSILKDANEFLKQGKEDELKQIWQNAKRYLPEKLIAVGKHNIRQLLGEAPSRGIPYPIKSLDAMTYGVRKGEAVLVTAKEGVGKTELLHAILHSTLKESKDAVGALFLEEPKGDLLRHLAGIELQRPAHLPDGGCSETDVVDAVGKSIGEDERLLLYSHFGSDDPDVLLDTIRFMVTARNVGVVFLDHIGMSVSGIVAEKDERRALDYLSTRLEMMVKELNFALILVSHVNDNGETRGSRLIGKNCDIRIDATRDVLNPDDAKRNTLHLSISKNRPIGKTGYVCGLLFDPFTRSYTEVSANDNGEINDGWEKKAA